MKPCLPQQRKEQADVRQTLKSFHALPTLTTCSYRRTILRTNRIAARSSLMLLALSGNRLGLPRYIRHI